MKKAWCRKMGFEQKACCLAKSVWHQIRQKFIEKPADKKTPLEKLFHPQKGHRGKN